MTWVSWRKTCAFKPNTLTSYFQWCGCASAAHSGSTIQIMGYLQYFSVPHIWTSSQGTSYSYHLGSPMLFSHPSIGKVLQSPLLYICDALFQYMLWWTRPAPLLVDRSTYLWQSPVIGHADLLIHQPEQTCSPLLHWPPSNLCDRNFTLPHTFLYLGLDYCGLCQLVSLPCPSNSLSL